MVKTVGKQRKMRRVFFFFFFFFFFFLWLSAAGSISVVVGVIVPVVDIPGVVIFAPLASSAPFFLLTTKQPSWKLPKR